MFRASRATSSALHRGRYQPVHIAVAKWSLEKSVFEWPMNTAESAWLPRVPLPQASESQTMAAMFLSSVGTSSGLPHCHDQQVHIEAMNSSPGNSTFAWPTNMVQSTPLFKVALPTPSKAEATTPMFRASRRNPSADQRGHCKPVRLAFANWSPGLRVLTWAALNQILEPVQNVACLKQWLASCNATTRIEDGEYWLRSLKQNRKQCGPLQSGLLVENLSWMPLLKIEFPPGFFGNKVDFNTARRRFEELEHPAEGKHRLAEMSPTC
ncbi:hypothetical protein HPB50_027754 [Hyalomma asiaticum]|nr:hypothetical protein HPB50_027754 [Hyalomma asiaticum]